MHSIYLRRHLKIILPNGEGHTPLNVVATFQKNLESLGFLLAEDLIQKLQTLSTKQTEALYRRVVKDLQELVGAHRQFQPFYPNFPTQVMAMPEVELYFNAIRYYWTLQRPSFSSEERPPLEEKPTYRIISLGSQADFESLFTLLFKAKTQFSPQDKQDVKWYIAQYRERIQQQLPETISCKENLAVIAAELLRTTSNGMTIIDSHIRTATDVMRVAVAMNDGDVSLAEPGKFGKFRRTERTALLGWVERAANRTEDMLRWKSRWIRLGERLHPGEYANRFPKAAAAFDVVRNQLPFATFNGQLEAALRKKETTTVISMLETRAGDFARRLDHLFRIGSNPTVVLEAFAGKALDISTPVLLQLMTHFRYRVQPAALRTFFPKGDVGNLFATTKPLPTLVPEVASQVVSICERTLIERFSKLPPLGKCYLDPQLKRYLVPFSQRSASKSLRTLVRGSRLPIPDGSTLRFFVWWKNGRSRVDIDLSAAMYNSDYKYIDTLAYYNLKNFGAHHSGDIVDAPKGAAEFIDIDISRCVSGGVRYVVMSLNSFTEQPYCDLPECFAGWMSRQRPNSGEVFEPKTVVDRVDVASNTRICLPALFDLAQREVIWSDIALKKNAAFVNNVQNNLCGVSLMVRAMTQLRKTDLYSLFQLHIKARGLEVEKLTDADSIFACEQGITPFDLDRITAEFM